MLADTDAADARCLEEREDNKAGAASQPRLACAIGTDTETADAADTRYIEVKQNNIAGAANHLGLARMLMIVMVKTVMMEDNKAG